VDTLTIAQAQQHCAALGLDRLDAQLLLLHALGRAPHERAWLLAHDTDALPEGAFEALATAAHRRCDGEPLAYITGHKAFYGLDLLVDARVLVPRPDTETLVDWALEVVPSRAAHASPPQRPTQTTEEAAPSVLDLGTGSGAIALALKSQRPAWQLEAVDASIDALAVARSNAERLGLEVEFRLGVWLEDTEGMFDAIVSNPPYIREHDEHLSALRFEPRQALTAGADGLDDIRTIIQAAPRHLKTGGWLLLEHAYDQAPAVRALLADAGYAHVQSRKDLSGIERCSGGVWMGHA
jgi:release factor glutamine methyltransferase